MMKRISKAIPALREADKLIVVGCSLREEDTFLRFALYHFGMKEKTDKFHVDLVDHGHQNCEQISKKLKGLVAFPDKQQVECFPGGLKAYLEKY